jgi:hypothetical protein
MDVTARLICWVLALLTFIVAAVWVPQPGFRIALTPTGLALFVLGWLVG